MPTIITKILTVLVSFLFGFSPLIPVFTPTVASAQTATVAVISLTNGPPNLQQGLIPANVPSGSPVSDVYADNVGNVPFSGTFSLGGANASNFSVSTASNCGSAGNIVCGHITTQGSLSAGTYSFTVTTDQGGSQSVTMQAVSGTQVSCGDDNTIRNAVNAAGDSATLIFPACTYSIGAGIQALSNQTWVGIPGKTIFDAGGSSLGGGAMVVGFDAGITGVTIANFTMQHVGNYASSPDLCDYNLGTCVGIAYIMDSNDGWTLRNNTFDDAYQPLITRWHTGNVNLINNLMLHGGHGAMGIGGLSSAGTLNVIGNEMGFMNTIPTQSCDDSGNKFLNNDFTYNDKFNYYHDFNGPAFWADSFNNQHYNFLGDTFIRIGTDAIYLEQQHSQVADISFSVFDNISDGSARTAEIPLCGGEGATWGAFKLDGSSGANFHDNNISARYVNKPGGVVNFNDEIGNGAGFVGNNTLHDNTVNFFTSDSRSTWGFDSTSEDTSGDSSNNNHFHLVGGNTGSDAHWYWLNMGNNPATFSQYQSQSGQDANSTIDTTDTSTLGCRHVACATAPVGAGGVPGAPCGSACTTTTGNTTTQTTGQTTTATTAQTTGQTTGGSTACTNYYITGVAIPTGYAAAYDIAGSSGAMEVLASCAKATPTLDIGRNNQADLVYKTAYIYQNNAWQAQNLTSSSALQYTNWYTAFASAPIPASSITTTTWTYAVGYVCHWNGVAWKCGCADAACATGKWQLQAYQRPAVTTTGQTTSQTTTQTTGQTTSQTTTGQLAATPPMGWNSWNAFSLSVTDAKVRNVVDGMVSSGMKDVGYQFIVIDDGWEGGRDGQGNIIPDASKFPDMKALADYVHSKGLKFGIYSSPGTQTCGGNEGSGSHEQQDANTFAQWGVDFLKYDLCMPVDQQTEINLYTTMHDALVATGRPIVYSMSDAAAGQPWTWGPSVGVNMWRTTGDLQDDYAQMSSLGFDSNSDPTVAAVAGPGHWNDPDMLMVGNGGMNADEYRTQMTLWAILAAPLMAGNNLANIPQELMSYTPAFVRPPMSQETISLLTNPEVIAVDQDSAGHQGTRVNASNGIELWARPLADGSKAVGLFNRNDTAMTVTFTFSDVGLNGQVHVRDLWARQDLGVQQGSMQMNIPAHGAAMLKVN